MTAEKIIGTIGTYTMIAKISFVTKMQGEIYQSLCFTPRRIIVAETGRFVPIENWKLSDLFWTKSDWRLKELNEPLNKEAREKAAVRAGELVKLPVESILESDKANFQIAYEEIVNVKLQKPDKIIGWPLTIITNTKKYKYALLNRGEFDNQVSLIRSVLFDKLVIS